jgi:hypothetical protein
LIAAKKQSKTYCNSYQLNLQLISLSVFASRRA